MAIVSDGRVDDSTSHRTVSAHIAKDMMNTKLAMALSSP